MSEDFLSRWSRRKREALEEAKDANAETPPDQGERAPDSETPLADPKAPATITKLAEPATITTAEPAFDLTSLPPIESITAATDIRPFLAPGVPPDLARAALRRAWTADPTIRNFVGLAEYAWDYHTPGSMAGFGPLEMTDELRQAVARIIGDLPAERAEAAPKIPSDRVKSAEMPNDIKAQGLPPPSGVGDSNRGAVQDSIAHRQDVASNPARDPGADTQHPAEQQVPAQRESTPLIVRRNHGGALPK